MDLDTQDSCPDLANFRQHRVRVKPITRAYVKRAFAHDPALLREDGQGNLDFVSSTELNHILTRAGVHLPKYPVPHRRWKNDPQRRWVFDVQEGRDLARSQVPLPSDHPVRRPSHEREDAVRDASTCKRNTRARLADSTVSVVPANTDPDLADLYRLGLLYDNEHLRGSGFSLNAIVHQEPSYTLRPAKRARKLNKTRGYDFDSLPLALSFAELHNDDAIAQFLISPSPSETSGENPWEDDFVSPAVTSEAAGSVHSFHIPFIPEQDVSDTHDIPVPDLVPDSHDNEPNPDSDAFCPCNEDDEPYVLPDKEADEVAQEVENDVREQNDAPAEDDDYDDAAASWILLGDDS